MSSFTLQPEPIRWTIDRQKDDEATIRNKIHTVMCDENRDKVLSAERLGLTVEQLDYCIARYNVWIPR